MNNYTHAYSDYVNHILNKSPSKTSFSFSKADRFPQRQSEIDFLEIDNHPAQTSYQQQDRYSRGKREKSPIRNRDLDKGYSGRNKDGFNQGSIRRNVEEIYNQDNRRANYSKRSKSPIRSQSPLHQNSTFQAGNQKMMRTVRQRSNYENSPSKQNLFKRSPSKSPSRQAQTNRGSPSKTFTQRLHDIDHISKNMTINGYYPTGIEITPEGKSPISKHKNIASYSFGRASSKQRYKYLVKSEDNLGPGYYDSFSEFGRQGKP